MSFHKSRIDTLKCLVAGSKSLSAIPYRSIIECEFDEVKNLSNINIPKRKYLLSVLHSTRALDTSLKRFVSYHGLSNKVSTSLGASLKYIQDSPPGILNAPFTLRVRFQNSIVKERNRYMHEAGAFPSSDNEIRRLLSEMDHCLSVVVNLE